jgi:hypothetical protein
MARFTIPANSGKFTVHRHFRGSHFTVQSDRKGARVISVASREEAEEICRRLNSGDHNGVISVRDLKR